MGSGFADPQSPGLMVMGEVASHPPDERLESRHQSARHSLPEPAQWPLAVVECVVTAGLRRPTACVGSQVAYLGQVIQLPWAPLTSSHKVTLTSR